ncbi:MAG: signal peptidase II [Spirochaetaceae bacterium]|jgi:signal peptidase II|nr:signal peptidase II [Spirochaetaceae bacterium]
MVIYNAAVKSNRDKILTKCTPFILTAILIALDQLIKFLVIMTIPPYHVGVSLFNDFFRIIHMYNPGIAFSLGSNLPLMVRSIMFAVIPLIIIILVTVTYFLNDSFSPPQQWAIAGVIGGGLSNLIDRFFRQEGVIDFIDVKFFGIFGFDRWPTFNIADMSVLICAGIFMITLILPAPRTALMKKNLEFSREPLDTIQKI